MASFTQVPGTLNVTLVAGDDLPATEIDFSIDITGITFVASILSAVTGATVSTFTVAITNAATGKLTVALTDAQTASLALGTYRWTLVGTYGGVTRTYLSGYVEVLR
jgi:hypothetical protein